MPVSYTHLDVYKRQPKDCVVAYLPQHLMTEDGRTVFDETAQAFSHLHEMEAQIEKLNKELETRTDYESDSYMALIEEVSALSEKFYSIDATNYEEDVYKRQVPQRAAAGLDPWATPQAYDNAKDFFDTGITWSNSLNVAQMLDKSSYSISLGNTHQDGIISSTGMDRYNVKVLSLIHI